MVQKGRNAKRGVGVLGVKNFLKLVQEGEMRKGGWVQKGWVRSSSAPGCEKIFSGASRPHPPKKNPEYAPVHNVPTYVLKLVTDIVNYVMDILIHCGCF